MSKEQTGLTPTSKNPEHETQSQFYRNNFIEQFYINLQFISNKLLGEKKTYVLLFPWRQLYRVNKLTTK